MPLAPLIVTALFGDGDNGWLQELRRAHYPPELNRVPAHLTLFRQLPPSVEQELNGRLAAYAAAPPPRAQIASVMDLGAGTALRVLSEELEDIRYDLMLALKGLLTPQDSGAWRPHITIQNKVDPRDARRLQSQLKGRFDGRPLSIKDLAVWRYLDGPWEPVRSHTFRG
ncbi:MAG TPA: 2'-5' RNA ligase family protein [Allosphingosinicella sp.]